jgi:peroxiredoxin Q/BCP
MEKNENKKAPDFELLNAKEDKVKLSDYEGKWVVLYFYPKNGTPGCTLEAMDFSKYKVNFEKLGAVILGISGDTCESHQKFIDKRGLTINLLSDPDAKVQKLYGVYKEKKMFGKIGFGTERTTFLINPEGEVEKKWEKVKAIGHAKEVLEFFKEKY